MLEAGPAEEDDLARRPAAPAEHGPLLTADGAAHAEMVAAGANIHIHGRCDLLVIEGVVAFIREENSAEGEI